MTERIPEDEQSNYEIFRECVSVPVLKALAVPAEKPKRRREKKRGGRGLGARTGRKSLKAGSDGDGDVNRREGPENDANNHPEKKEDMEKPDAAEDSNDAEDLGDFIDYLSSLLFTSLPTPLRRLTPTSYATTPSLQNHYALPLPPTTTTTLTSTLSPTALLTLESYTLLPSPPSPLDLSLFFTPIYTAYVTSTSVAPLVPIWSATRASACELCQRDWIPLTYHHLIPRSTHAKVLKRGWHKEGMLGSVAWLCRACHSFVHRVAGNEELARWWWSVGLLEQRDDVRKWVSWVGRVRWKAR